MDPKSVITPEKVEDINAQLRAFRGRLIAIRDDADELFATLRDEFLDGDRGGFDESYGDDEPDVVDPIRVINGLIQSFDDYTTALIYAIRQSRLLIRPTGDVHDGPVLGDDE